MANDLSRSRVPVWLPAAMLVLTLACAAQVPVTVTIGTEPRNEIPRDFAGLSFESSNLNPDKEGNHLFSPANTALINLFRAIGIRSLRVGGGTADGGEFRIPDTEDIDQLFAFAEATDLRVIYTLRLLNGDAQKDAALAKYIESHYPSRLVCLQLGNEPDWHSFHTSTGHLRDPRIVETISEAPGSAYASFLADWQMFAAAILQVAPEARFTGPDTGSDFPVPGTKNTDASGKSWTERFAEDEGRSGRLVFVTAHDYPGQSAVGVPVPTAVDAMLSSEWLSNRYAVFFNHALAPVERLGMTYRMTEANDYTGGVDGASNAFASALWALDYLHWHAAHGAAGVNFHNKSWIFTDTILRAPDGEYQFNPKAYAFEAFNEGSNGRVLPVSLADKADVNLTAYAVKGTDGVYLTLINKEHGANARTVTVSIRGGDPHGELQFMALVAPGNQPTAREGITFGGAAISANGWHGSWKSVVSKKPNDLEIDVAPSSAILLKMKRSR